MAGSQRAMVVRAAVAAVVLVAALAAEADLDSALAQARAHHRAHHGGHRGHHHATAPHGRPAAKPKPNPQSKPNPKPGVKPQPGQAVDDLADRAVALGLPARLDDDGATVDVGYADAPVQLTLFEDYRCDSTGPFENRQGPTLRMLMARHQLLVHYVIESSLDERLPGPGAVLASDAARAALAHGGFPLFHALLFANQPAEEVDGFTPARLLDIASHVPGLRGAAFDAEVRTLYWKPWVDAAQHVYDTSGVHHGTPSMLLDGTEVDLWAHPELLNDPGALQRFVENAANRGQ
ncbi:DsbA family protein [Streptacidiphilus fuscans]|uniref:Thioredoxin domain-containing protein n=1 Tax=Streptacidiphilus fuscans TaxID=2789292 RepID=A0A931B5T3_9ACTN|nr:thioredoxin domain-containing protein [Streptacidiphilus fuscans]MBF9070929.1 thioredoxin domain-containing protein [Streptacidiphilus fuscans]